MNKFWINFNLMYMYYCLLRIRNVLLFSGLCFRGRMAHSHARLLAVTAVLVVSGDAVQGCTLVYRKLAASADYLLGHWIAAAPHPAIVRIQNLCGKMLFRQAGVLPCRICFGQA